MMRCVVCPVCGHLEPIKRSTEPVTAGHAAWQAVDDHIMSRHTGVSDVFPVRGVRTDCPVCRTTVVIIVNSDDEAVLSRHCKPVSRVNGKDLSEPEWCEASLMTRDDADDLTWSRVPGRRPGVYTCPHHP